MLDEGTTSRSATQIAEEQERLGATISAGASLDAERASPSTALTANLAPSLALIADVVRNPAFAAGRGRAAQGPAARQHRRRRSPARAASRSATLPPLLFGAGHPYGQPADGLGDADGDRRADARRACAPRTASGCAPTSPGSPSSATSRWTELLPLLEQAFGDWQAPAGARARQGARRAVPAPRPRIVLIDRPNSPQSVIFGGRVLPLTGRDPDKEALDLANEVLGGGFLSRLNSDLREDKGWSYGVSSAVRAPVGPRSLAVLSRRSRPTAPAIRSRADRRHEGLPGRQGRRPGRAPARDRGQHPRAAQPLRDQRQVLGAIVANDRLGRPGRLLRDAAGRYRAIDAKALNAAARRPGSSPMA